MKQARDPEALREVIVKSGLSNRALARAALCSKNTPGRLTAGRPTSNATAARLEKILGRTPGDLFEDVVSTDEQHTGNQGAAA